MCIKCKKLRLYNYFWDNNFNKINFFNKLFVFGNILKILDKKWLFLNFLNLKFSLKNNMISVLLHSSFWGLAKLNYCFFFCNFLRQSWCCLSFLKWGNLRFRLMSQQLIPSVSNCCSKLFELRLTDLARPWLRRKVAEAIRFHRWQFVKNVHVVSVGIIVIVRLRPAGNLFFLSWWPFKDFLFFFFL
jgi:hypothetical protein